MYQLFTFKEKEIYFDSYYFDLVIPQGYTLYKMYYIIIVLSKKYIIEINFIARKQ